MKNMKEKLSKKLKKKNGFTLIEMLIVVAIIAILVVVSIPLVTTSMDKAEKATDDANIRAAKAEAVIEYLGNDKEAGTYYYDAENGILVDSAPSKGYNQQGTKNTSSIKVTITKNPAEGTPNITCVWNPALSEEA